jgi:hypothetical protein
MEDKKQFCAMLMKVGPRFPGLDDYSEGDERIASAQYSCLQTATPIGPDNRAVEPQLCNKSRKCYKAH